MPPDTSVKIHSWNKSVPQDCRKAAVSFFVLFVVCPYLSFWREYCAFTFLHKILLKVTNIDHCWALDIFLKTNQCFCNRAKKIIVQSQVYLVQCATFMRKKSYTCMINRHFIVCQSVKDIAFTEYFNEIIYWKL